MNKIILVVIFYTLFAGISLAQTFETSKGKPVKDLIQDAERYVNMQQFQPAKLVLEEAIKRKPNFVIAYRLLGIVNSKLKNHAEAVVAYEKLFEMQAGLSKAAYFECGQACMKMYAYDKALGYFNLYKNADSRDYKTDEKTIESNYNLYVDREIRSCKYARNIDFSIEREESINLGTAINSAADEYLPTLTGDGRWLIFTSNSAGENILISKPKANGDWEKARSISPAINTPRNEGMAKLSVCGRMIYFSACAWENVKGGCDIFEADFDSQFDFSIVDAVRPTKGVNSDRWESQPAISCDGKTLFFASTREGGQGGTDLWMSSLREDGIWDEPVNMGKTINTNGDEEAPYIAPDGITLYFSSDGHAGLGEADIFRTVRREDGTWGTPVNLGPSVNTPYREAGIVISPDGAMAYYSSAKEGGEGGLDIYKIAIHPEIAPEKANVMVDAYVYDAATKEPIPNVKVKIGQSGSQRQEFETDKNGRFFVCLPDKASYSYILMNPKYETFVGAEVFKREKNEPTKKIEIFLIPTTFTPEQKVAPKRNIRKNLSIYFDSGKYDIKDLQKEQLDRMIWQFEDKTSIKIRVIGYADDVGNREFNLALSIERAKTVATYISTLGLESSQIDFEGGGIAEDNIEKHQKRRTDILIDYN